MNIKQVNYFVSVSELGSLSAAARESGVSVQALSKAMTDLEKDLPEPLFIRTHQGIQLTDFGEAFYRKAVGVCEEFHELESMADIVREQNSKLKLFLCTPAFYRNARARAEIASFFKKYLNLETEVLIGTGRDGMTALVTGSCTALITIGALHHADVDCFSVGTVPTGICISKSHPLADRASVTLADLKPYPVLASKEFDHFNDSILVTYRRGELESEIIEPDFYEMPFLFYFKHAICLMACIPSLGELMPHSIMVPIVDPTAKPIPVCLVTPKNMKTESYLRLEHLMKTLV